MASIAEKLAAAKQAAVASSGLQGTTAASATPAATPGQAGTLPTRRSASVLNPEDLVPRKTSKDEVLFKSVKANLGFIIAPDHKQAIRGRFTNHYYLTKDPVIIAYIRTNAKAFGVVEVDSPAVKQGIDKGPTAEEIAAKEKAEAAAKEASAANEAAKTALDKANPTSTEDSGK